ncbi:acyltransferase [Sphingobacterium sp. N143]|uniref:acyltransferase family protein n=1 Tax=Sphingobacterium sp. N143 TaxID=2746727 RepID=UPI0025781829|nr:acyltransferase [Sphingobacterium sp. N143]MDM1296304.1 acyltransferase [Sphingobacterium sp. N143]
MNLLSTDASVSSQKPHFILLDGLRGIAALIILLFHYLEMIYVNDYESNWLGHGYLAVDFFFCLSGFVIAYAYDGRIDQIGIKKFFTNRLVRLHPLVVFGTLIGLIGYLFNPFIPDPASSGMAKIIFASLFSLILLPFPFIDYRGGGLFPFNTPSWSLFFEYIANIIYAVVLSRIARSKLLVLCLLAGAFLVLCASRAGWLIGGWDILSVTDGIARVSFSFLAGMLIYRYQLIIPNKQNYLILCLLFTAVFFFPHHNGDWISECIIVMLVFPLFLSIAAGTSVTKKASVFLSFIGNLSYPLYMTHITSVWLFGDYYTMHQPNGIKLVGIVTGLMLFNLLIAYVVMRWVDTPLRKKLTALQRK